MGGVALLVVVAVTVAVAYFAMSGSVVSAGALTPPGASGSAPTSGDGAPTPPGASGSAPSSGGKCVSQAGKFCVSPLDANAQDCSVGYYADVAGLPACKPCAAGTYADTVGSSQCKACPAGSFCPAQSGSPLPCPAGYFCPDASMVMPRKCPSNTFCPVGAASVTNCPSSTRSAAGSGSASDCKEGPAPLYTKIFNARKVENVIMSDLWDYGDPLQWNKGVQYINEADGLRKALAGHDVRAINIPPGGNRIDIIRGAQGWPSIKLKRASGWDVYLIDPTIELKILPENASINRR